LPAVGQPVRILTHLAVREDAHVLYGFMTPAERDLFRLLVNNVSGIGPKLALAVLSGMSVDSFKAAVVNSDFTAISKISGRGNSRSCAAGNACDITVSDIDALLSLCVGRWTFDVRR